MPLDKSFYNQDTINLAQSLLGKLLVHETIEGKCSGIINEVEAYLGSEDPASHTYKGITKRNQIMFDKPGLAYIYFTYGKYFCFNITSAPKGIGHGILIRSIEPIEGIDLMIKRRNILDLKNLTNGPAKLVIAMGINKSQYGHDLTKKPLYIEQNMNYTTKEILKSPRIGISIAKDLEYRFRI